MAAESDASRGTWLLQRLQRLALETDLFDTSAAAQVLEMEGRVETVVEAPRACADGDVLTARTVKWIPSEGTWYVPTSTGAGDVLLPPIAINPAMRTGSPVLTYTVELGGCANTSWRDIDRHTRAKLELRGLPAYACITSGQIQKVLRNTSYRMATDGYSGIAASGRRSDMWSSRIHFTFRFGSDCALAVEVEQDEGYGLRYLRAQSKYLQCRTQADRAYCDIHPNATADDERLRALRVERCGTLNAVYSREPLSGERPQPLPLMQTSYRPCEDLKSPSR